MIFLVCFDRQLSTILVF